MSSTVQGLKDFLKKNGISVVQLAKNTGIPQDRIYSWLRGKGNPKAEDQKILDGVMGIGITPNELDTKKPTSDEAGEVVADQELPAVYQRIIDELIEQSKSQRKAIDTIQNITQSVTRITDALLDERQQMRATAVSLHTLEERAEETDQTLEELQTAVVFGFAQALKRKPEEIEVMLHTGEWAGKSKASSKKVAGN